MTDWSHPNLSIDNECRSKEKVRHLTAEQLGIPEKEADQEPDQDKWEQLEDVATSADSGQGYAVAVSTADGKLATGEFLKAERSHEVHAVELAVWKAYSKSNSSIAKILAIEEEAEFDPCGRCIQVAKDFGYDITIRVLGQNGDVSEYTSIDVLLADDPPTKSPDKMTEANDDDAIEPIASDEHITDTESGTSSSETIDGSDDSDLEIEYVRFENVIYHKKYKELDRTFCGQKVSTQESVSSKEEPILLEPCKPCHGELGVVTLEEKKQNFREEISEQTADISFSEATPAQFTTEELRALLELIPVSFPDIADSDAELRLQLQRAVENVQPPEAESNSFTKDEMKALVEALNGIGVISMDPHFYIQTDTGIVKRTPITGFPLQNRGGKGIRGINPDSDSSPSKLFVAKPRNELLLFTSHGKVYQISGHEIPQMERTEPGIQFSEIIPLDEDESVQALHSMRSLDHHEYLTLVTKKGFVKRVETSQFENILSTGIRAAELEDGDEIMDVAWTEGNGDLLIATAEGQAIRFDEDEVAEMGRSARGIRGIELSSNDTVAGMSVIHESSDAQLLSVTKNGYGKRTPVEEYRTQSRYGRGLIDIDTGERNGPLVAVDTVQDDESVGILSHDGQLIRSPIKDISSVGRNTKGVILIDVDEDDYVIGAGVITNNT